MKPWMRNEPSKGGSWGKGGKNYGRAQYDRMPNFSYSPPGKRFRSADDELSLLRTGVKASLNLGLDTARLVRNILGMVVPTIIIIMQPVLKNALSVEPIPSEPVETFVQT